MANKRITELTDIGTPASNDVLEIVDVSDTTDSPEGTSKKVLVSALGGSSTTPNLSEVLLQGNRELKEVVTDEGEEFYTFVSEDKSKIVYGFSANQYKIPKDVFNTNDELIYYYSGGDVYPITPNTDVQIFIDDVSVSSVSCNVTCYLKFKHTGGNQWICTKETYTNETVIIDGDTIVLNNQNYVVISNSTITDPTPAEGKGYTVFVRNGTATIGGVGYTAGSLVYRFYQGGVWETYNQSGFIPLAGTTEDNKVTGDIEVSESAKTFWIRGASYPDDYYSIAFGEGGITINYYNVDEISSKSVLFTSAEGLFGDSDYSELNPESKNIYAQRQYVDNQFGKLIALTETEILAITTPENGIFYYNTDINCPVFYDGTEWKKVSNTTM